jgi:GTP-binding protein HflX
LEEIVDSRLLIHLVDAANPRWSQQVQSVERILQELKLAEIPSLLVLNKADLVTAETLEAISRQLTLNSTRPVISVAANDQRTLRPLLEKIGEMLSRDIGLSAREAQFDAERLSRIA